MLIMDIIINNNKPNLIYNNQKGYGSVRLKLTKFEIQIIAFRIYLMKKERVSDGGSEGRFIASL